MRRRFFISLLLLLVALWSCRRTAPEPIQEGATGSLTLLLGSRDPQTKADPEDPSLDGYAFKNVLVIIADANRKVIDKVYKTYPHVQEQGDIQGTVAASQVTNDAINFRDLKVGAYQVYVYANIKHTDWQKTGSTVEEVEKTLAAGTGTLDVDHQLAALSGSQVPAIPAGENGMLLTGHKELFVGVHENIGEVDLLRPVVRFNVYIHNHTPFSLTLNKLDFTPFNASASYLLDHRADDGSPVVPDETEYRKLPAYDEANPKIVEAPTGSEATAGRELVYRQLLYENKIKGDYRMFATVTLNVVDANDTPNPIQQELVTDGVRLVPYEEMAALEEGESKQVLLVNPNSKNGNFYGWSGSKLVYSAAKYGLLTSFNAHAEDLLKNAEIGSYYVLTLTRTADGRFTFRHKNKSDSFLKLVKVGNSSMTEDALTMVEGAVPSAMDFPVSPEFSGFLFRFHDSNSTPRFLYNVDNQLKADDFNITAGNRVWALYEAYPKGSVLKFIDNETAQVKPLDYMRRNEELNVVMNVYYQEVSHTLSFEVENTYWNENNAHKPTVEFN